MQWTLEQIEALEAMEQERSLLTLSDEDFDAVLCGMYESDVKHYQTLCEDVA